MFEYPSDSFPAFLTGNPAHPRDRRLCDGLRDALAPCASRTVPILSQALSPDYDPGTVDLTLWLGYDAEFGRLT